MLTKQVIRGLVLEGGGAKGAYALGCLLALEEKGIRFDVISGTSVGALNAAISSAELLESGKELWKNLSFSKVCSNSKLTTWIIFPLHLLGLFLHHVPIIGAMPFPNRLKPQSGYSFIAIVIGIPILLIWILLLITILFVDIGPSLLNEVLVINAIMIFFGFLWAIPFWMRQKNRSLFNTTPLRNEISNLLEDRVIKIPTYITTAYRRELFDPDKPGFYHIGTQFNYVRSAMAQEEYLPHYIRLDTLSNKSRIDFLTASAAIPFGIFPSVLLEGVEYIDGGIIDNTPIFPILQYHECDEIYVVRLRPNHSGDIQKAWQTVDRILRVDKISKEECKKMYFRSMQTKKISEAIDEIIDPPENVPFRDLPFRSDRVIIISPQKSLGSFWRGTMNFTSRYTNKLLKMGFDDTLRILSHGSCYINSSLD